MVLFTGGITGALWGSAHGRSYGISGWGSSLGILGGVVNQGGGLPLVSQIKCLMGILGGDFQGGS